MPRDTLSDRFHRAILWLSGPSMSGPQHVGPPACQELGATPRGRLPFNSGFATTYRYGASTAYPGCEIADLSTTPRSCISARVYPESMTGSPANDSAAFDINQRTVEGHFFDFNCIHENYLDYHQVCMDRLFRCDKQCEVKFS
jgi:hypothetical protein